jgi:hypothetical protein
MRVGERRRMSRATVVGLAVALAAVLALALVVVFRTEEPAPPLVPDRPFAPGAGRPFSATSPFNDPIGEDVVLDRDSAAMVDTLTGETPTAHVYDDVPPIYDADASTPRSGVDCTMAREWGIVCPFAGLAIPIPRGAEPSSGSDDTMVVIDWSTRTAYGFWQYRGDRETTSWGEVSSIDGQGSDETGVTGSGISRLAGIIRTYEVRQGYIPHALVGATGNSCSEHRYPATKSDGWSDRPGCIPEGARVQLDPSVDCDDLPGARPFEVMVCRAMQTYGWYNIDNGGPRGNRWFGVQFENPAGEADPYPAVGIEWDHMAMPAIPWDRLRVLAAWDSHSGAAG